MKRAARDRADADVRVVEAFGEEWSRFSNESLSVSELTEMFEAYMAIFPWDALPEGAVGFDAGCGSGRWAKFVAPRVGYLHCVDASDQALAVARRVLREFGNVDFRHESLGDLSIDDSSCDFGYSLGVLHHIPDTEEALAVCVAKLRPGAPFLAYLYYDLEEANSYRRLLLACAGRVRWFVSRLPRRIRHFLADALAFTIYLPLARLARVVEQLGKDPSGLPLFQYRSRSFYVMRNDALDRFGTRLEKRFSRHQVVELFHGAGLEEVVFSNDPPWWVALGWRPPDSEIGPASAQRAGRPDPSHR